MKWILLAIALAGVLPLAGWLRRNPHGHPKIWALLGCLPFLVTALPRLEAALIGWPTWPGMSKGIEISALDVLTLAIYLSLPHARRPLPFRASMGFYFAVVLLSAIQAAVPFAVFFYTWQLGRVFLVYAVVARACADERVSIWLLKGMAVGLCFEACVVVWERVTFGAIQAAGTFGHQNLLGIASHFVIFPFFALLLAGERGWWPVVTTLAGAIIAALTASRATIGLVAVGLTLVFALSAVRRWTVQVTRVALLAPVALAVLSSLALSSLQERFTAQPLSEYDERAALITASAMMLSDRPMGVGANNFAVVNNTAGYAVRAEVDLPGRGALVHNIYWLALAETGYLGLLALIILLTRPLIVAVRCWWQFAGDRRAGLMIGFTTSLLIIYVHSYFEWVFLTIQIQYLFAMTVGMVAALAQQMGYWGRANLQVSSGARLPATVIGGAGVQKR